MQRQGLTLVVALAVTAFGVGVTAAPIQGPDTTTQGNWVSTGNYGSQGYILPAFSRTSGTVFPGSNADDLALLPTAIDDYQVGFYSTGTGAGRGLWSPSTTEVRALEHPTIAGLRKPNYWFDVNGFDVTMKLNGPARYTIGLYDMSWDSHARSSTITVPGKTPVVTGDIYDGKWYTTDVSGDEFNPIKLSIQKAAGSNVVLTGITFDQATDNSTQGSWVGVYGSDGYILPGFKGASPTSPGDQSYDRFSLPSYIDDYSFSLNDGKRYQWGGAASDPRGVQDPDNPSGARKASIVYDTTEIGLQLEANVPTYFDLSLYVLDWDGQLPSGHRVETIAFNSPDIDDVVAREFRDGRWYLYRVYAGPGDPLYITLTPSGSNAVVSAICFDKGDMFPEPTTLALLAGGLLAAAVRRRRRT